MSGRKAGRRAGRKSGRGALVILALILASSGALRLGAGVGQAMANGAEHDTSEPLNCPVPPAALAAALVGRESHVREQEEAVAERMAALALADEAITKRLDELKTAEEELKQTLSIADGAAEKDLARLTAVYEAMRPADAAVLFQTMAPEFAVGFMGRMRPEIAASVLAGMKPDKAYSISVLIAGRNATAPKE
jgi:flagellar motility protein MotE (MotC chaperone)